MIELAVGAFLGVFVALIVNSMVNATNVWVTWLARFVVGLLGCVALAWLLEFLLGMFGKI